jgi:hypothetical protein
MNLFRLALLVSLLLAVGCWNSSSRGPSSSPVETGIDEANEDMLAARAQEPRKKAFENAKKDVQEGERTAIILRRRSSARSSTPARSR